MSRKLRIVVLALAAAALIACEEKKPDQSYRTIPRAENQTKGTASIRGTVIFKGKPAAGVTVLLCGYVNGLPLSGSKCEPSYGKTVTDESGAYSFTDLKVNNDTANEDFKFYTPVAVADGDPPAYYYWQKVNSMTSDSVAPKPDEAYEFKPIDLPKRSVRLLAPAQDEKISEQRPSLRWEEYPGATQYEVTIKNRYGKPRSISVDGTTPGSRPAADLTPGLYEWSVAAFDNKSEKLSESARSAGTFEVLKDK